MTYSVLKHIAWDGSGDKHSTHKTLELATRAFEKNKGMFYALDVVENWSSVKNWKPLFGIANGYTWHTENDKIVWDDESMNEAAS